MEKRTIGFIGGGRVTKIMLEGLKNASVELGNIIVFDPNEENLLKLKKIFPEVTITSEGIEQVAITDVIFIAVHPPMVLDTIEKMKPYVKEKTMIVSLAPKITIEQIQTLLPEVKSIARVNPSAPNIINQGVNPIAFAKTVYADDQAYIMELLGKTGKTFLVDESKIEAYAVICAMGSTYFWFQLQHLEEMGVQFGLEQEEVKLLLKDMMSGTLNTLFFSNLPVEEVMDLVPVKPIGEYEDAIKGFYNEKLTGIYTKIKPL